MSASVMDEQPRAGFWRRLVSSAIDVVIVGAPFQIIVAVLFAMTAGSIQMTSNGFVVQSCERRTTVPAGLAPAPPPKSNFANECRFSLFGIPTGRRLIVGRAERDGNGTRSVFRSYMLNAAGEPIQGTSIDGYVFLVLVAYVLALTALSGQTLGARAMRIRVVDIAHSGSVRVPLRRILIRYAAMLIGFVPAVVVLLVDAHSAGGDLETAHDVIAGKEIGVAILVALAWEIVLIGQIALKRDPVYDRLAGTAVIRLPASQQMPAAERPLPS
ncbi:MAG: RDD family protein [Bradyrhizobium sp.]